MYNSRHVAVIATSPRPRGTTACVTSSDLQLVGNSAVGRRLTVSRKTLQRRRSETTYVHAFLPSFHSKPPVSSFADVIFNVEMRLHWEFPWVPWDSHGNGNHYASFMGMKMGMEMAWWEWERIKAPHFPNYHPQIADHRTVLTDPCYA